MEQIIVLKESRGQEGRVALTPQAVSQLISKIPVMVESTAGLLAGFSDKDYIDAGAAIFTLDSKLPANSFILRVKCPTKEREIIENEFIAENSVMMGFLDPLEKDLSHIARWKKQGIKLIALELLTLEQR